MRKLLKLVLPKWIEAGSSAWFQELDLVLDRKINEIIATINRPVECFSYSNSADIVTAGYQVFQPDVLHVDTTKGYVNGRFVVTANTAGIYQVIIAGPIPARLHKNGALYQDFSTGNGGNALIDLRVSGEYFEVLISGTVNANTLMISAVRLGNSG